MVEPWNEAVIRMRTFLRVSMSSANELIASVEVWVPSDSVSEFGASTSPQSVPVPLVLSPIVPLVRPGDALGGREREQRDSSG